jgi:hypothetical protein
MIHCLKLFLECLEPNRTRALDLKVDKDKLHRMPIPTNILYSVWMSIFGGHEIELGSITNQPRS